MRPSFPLVSWTEGIRLLKRFPMIYFNTLLSISKDENKISELIQSDPHQPDLPLLQKGKDRQAAKMTVWQEEWATVAALLYLSGVSFGIVGLILM